MSATTKTLLQLYTDAGSPGGYSGQANLFRAAKQTGLKVNLKQVRQFLATQPTYSIHHQQRIRFPRRRVVSYAIDWLWELDLAEMPRMSWHNKGYKFLLVKIDVLSKRLNVVPLHDKQAKNILEAMRHIIEVENLGIAPKFISCDRGTEFTNKLLADYLKTKGTKIYFMKNPETGAPNAERVIRTLKGRLYRYMTQHKTKRYIDVLPEIVSAYNNSKHRSIGMTPAQVTLERTHEIFDRLYPEQRGRDLPDHKLPLDQSVRIRIERATFHRGFAPQFTPEIFKVAEHLKSDPPTYTLRSTSPSKQLILGAFYDAELQPVSA